MHSKRRGRAESTTHAPTHNPHTILGEGHTEKQLVGGDGCIECRINAKVPPAAESGPEVRFQGSHRSDMQVSKSAHPVGTKLQLLKPTSESHPFHSDPFIHS